MQPSITIDNYELESSTYLHIWDPQEVKTSPLMLKPTNTSGRLHPLLLVSPLVSWEKAKLTAKTKIASSKITIGHQQQRYKDICKHKMGSLSIGHSQWQGIIAAFGRGRCVPQHQLKKGEEGIISQPEER